jgi:hypothetical protein
MNSINLDFSNAEFGLKEKGFLANKISYLVFSYLFK